MRWESPSRYPVQSTGSRGIEKLCGLPILPITLAAPRDGNEESRRPGRELTVAFPTGRGHKTPRISFFTVPTTRGGRGTNDFRSLKENIWHASCFWGGRIGASGQSPTARRRCGQRFCRMARSGFTLITCGGIPTWHGETMPRRSPLIGATRMLCACALPILTKGRRSANPL